MSSKPPCAFSSSYAQRFLFEDLDISGTVVRLTDVWQALQNGRDYPAPAAHLFGECMATATAISAGLEQPGRLTFNLKGNGLIEMLTVECTPELNLRGYVYTNVPIRTTVLHDLVGDARFSLEIDGTGHYTTIIPLDGDNIAQVFSNYLTKSEQQATGLWLACSQTAAAALLLQKLPGADARDPDGWRRIRHLTHTVRANELLNLDSETLLRRLFSEEDIRLYIPRAVIHDWPADPEKIAAILRAMGEKDVRAVLA
ncbi:MAG: Hsp33 family molecular chaperone HslO, partial [Azoarcus sp.]|nr:Hsp33 family molecular chaperone HslO [Azoarcus sp.]